MRTSTIIVQAVVFVLLAFLLWDVDKIRRTQRLLARRVLGMDVPAVSDKLSSHSGASLQREDIQTMLPVLRQRIPELKDPKKLLEYLESRGLTHIEIKTAIDILNSEQQKPAGQS